MHLSEVGILSGLTPGCVAEGRFTLLAPHYPGGEPISPEGARIAFFMGGAFGARLQLLELTEEAPGLFSWGHGRNRLSLHLPATVNLERLLSDLAWARFAPGPQRVEWAELSMNCEFGFVSGRIPALEVEAKPLEAGLSVSFRGETETLTAAEAPLEPPTPLLALAGSRIEADIIVPWEFLALQESELAVLGEQFRKRGERVDIPFDFGRPGLSGVAFDRGFGWPYFQGRFAVEGGRTPSPCVQILIRDRELVLRPAGKPLLLSDGFAAASTFDPALTLFGCGPDAWARALNGNATGSLTLSGDGVGHLTEASHRGHVVGHYAISTCRATLTLGETELVLAIAGEVDRMLQHSGPPLPPRLGPPFEVEARIPKAFLAARAIDLQRWADQQRHALSPNYG